MYSINILRQTVKNLTLRSLGMSKFNSKYQAGQKVGELFTNEILQLPATPIGPIQDLNPDSSNYGSFTFMIGQSPLGADPLE